MLGFSLFCCQRTDAPGLEEDEDEGAGCGEGLYVSCPCPCLNSDGTAAGSSSPPNSSSCIGLEDCVVIINVQPNTPQRSNFAVFLNAQWSLKSTALLFLPFLQRSSIFFQKAARIRWKSTKNENFFFQAARDR
jgi:hypothetical protein